MDNISKYIKQHPGLPIELKFFDKNSADIFKGASRSLEMLDEALYQKNLIKSVNNGKDFPASLQSTPAYEISFVNKNINAKQIIASGKILSDKLDNLIVEWMIFKKIVDPAQLNDDKIWKDSSDEYVKKYYKSKYKKDVKW